MQMDANKARRTCKEEIGGCRVTTKPRGCYWGMFVVGGGLTPLGDQIAFFGPNFKLAYLSRSGELEAQIKVCWSRRRIFQVVVRVCNNIVRCEVCSCL